MARPRLIALLAALLVLLPSYANACALCAAFDGVVFPHFHLEVDSDQLQSIAVEWEFSPSFTQVLRTFVQEADDSDQTRQKLLDAFEADIVPYNYLTRIELDGEPVDVKSAVTDSHFEFEGDVASYHFTIGIYQELGSRMHMELEFFDPRRYLSFFLRPEGMSYQTPPSVGVQHNLHDYPHTLLLSLGSAVEPQQATTASIAPPIKESQSWYQNSMDHFSKILQQASQAISNSLKAVKNDGSVLALVTLLAFSFGYGLLHAAGPGHGKSLVASYFLAGKQNYIKAAFMSLLIGIVHVFSAFIFTIILLFVLDALLTSALQQPTKVMTQISGTMIVAIAIYLAISKFRSHRLHKKHASMPGYQEHHQLNSLEATHCSCRGCSAPASKGSDAMLVFSAGMVPCPGTITIFLFSLSMGLYLVGFIAAIVMSLGMGLVIFGAAALSIVARNTLSSSYHRLSRVVEYASVVFIGVLGGLLLLMT
ncbi:DUF1007 family protein [Desulfurispira natronophila]|uniref:Nickel/cobalt efflux system n=1 Tax=Desulfurispira natronophila TaxID=682562 RepID=A0A7W7Y3H8_9BACT|nr:DUF1007 family protein [Desulfurispira natronophila]MBB5021388.1 ABC-type nickel/cobalt efflux system permease component RcnA [Desulfurispira natronophila]